MMFVTCEQNLARTSSVRLTFSSLNGRKTAMVNPAMNQAGARESESDVATMYLQPCKITF
jgi:hypothetical protein